MSKQHQQIDLLLLVRNKKVYPIFQGFKIRGIFIGKKHQTYREKNDDLKLTVKLFENYF